ncbi:alpha/beta-hydrolase [Amniculicola lignicola CBS 123094]|uniref:Carboxypeptidase n=1 Tax=Amniculicola lignicola CBS 123094 TaxID=1392246 RepID=A0A6A5WJC3_9PLEO|nr:alpha/beta-hydrolase [Amniculicola lignicola CBS 123094]
MVASVFLWLFLPVLAIALPWPPQRPILLDDLKAGRHNSSELRRECFETFDTTTNKNDTVCVNSIVNPGPGSGAKPLNWGASLQFVGYIDYDAGNSHSYFWLVMSENNPLTAPLVLWLNGGPGASSLLGLFDQWGPRKIVRQDKDATSLPKLEDNKYRVTQNLNWLFLEHPLGVGFSNSNERVRTSNDAAIHVLRFLTGFLSATFAHPDNKAFQFSGTPLHIAGESYAGHYIPAIGDALIKNGNLWKAWNVQSLIIGNGFVDVAYTAPGLYDLFCAEPPLIVPDKPAVAKQICDKHELYTKDCMYAVQKCRNKVSHTCQYTSNQCRDASGRIWAEDLGRDIYDYKKSTKQGLERTRHYGKTFKTFLDAKNAPTENAIGADPNIQWEYTKGGVFDDFLESGDWAKSYLPELEFVLSAGKNVLLYAGDQDLAVPFTAVKATAEELRWNNRDTFRECLRRPEDQLKKLGTYGSYVRFDQLTFARIYGAGHMINENKPAEAKDMFEKWILRNTEFTNCV